MGQDSYEDNLPLAKFFNRLNDNVDWRGYVHITELKEIMHSPNEIIKKVGTLLYKNFNRPYSVIGNPKEKRCSDLNYWLDSQKEFHKSDELGTNSPLWNLIENLWTNLQNGESFMSYCIRKSDNRLFVEKKKRKELENYCENRDYLKYLCRGSSGNNIRNYNICQKLSYHTEKYYKYFFQDNICTPDVVNDEYTLKISEECTLFDMSKTFPKYSFGNNQFSEDKNTREEIRKCGGYINSEGHSTQEERVIQEEEAVSEASILTSRNVAIYTSVTFLGIFSIIFYLYKFTFLGSWLHNRKIKENITLNNGDVIERDILLDSTSNNVDDNLRSSEYYLSYQFVEN
ncbi:PIR Superfamily Protein [Plasmodium ovale wallikeri]|uniref:PIR Superfamily Protein n=1 Tax=Plasmodium ovale wallikeri TaxID=864142 RepID=A0A1A9AQW9_PLAOA|nr:PIR Superfamily Protein [Plasmodium ovale wallikeri]